MKKILYILLVVFAISCSREIKPPITEKIPFSERHFGIMLRDDYHWLKDKSRKNDKVIAHLKDENRYADAVLKHTQKLQDEIYKEAVGRYPDLDVSVPVKIGDYLYYSKSYNDKQYKQYFRKKDEANAKEECYLDLNEMAKDKKFFSLSEMEISPNQNLLAISIDTTGAENYYLRIKNLKTGEFLKDFALMVASITWLDDNTLYYTVDNSSHRTYRLYKHKLGESYKRDKLIYQENDPLYYIWAYKTRSKRFIILDISSKNSSEMRYLDVKHPEEGFKVIIPRKKDVIYYVDDWKNNFIIQTNDDNAINNKVVIAPIKHPQKRYWKTLIPESDSTSISVSVFNKFMVVKQRKNGLVTFLIKPFAKTQKEFYVKFPENTYSAYMSSNPDYNTDYFRYGYESYITPYSVYELDIKSGKSILLKQFKIKGGYDKNQYFTTRFFATAKDGTKIPISIVYKKDLFKRDGNCPILLEGYGAYGDASDTYFAKTRLSLLNRGFACATAHVRGGGEYGRKWYNQGKMLNKKNTFTDFISCAEYLIENNYTSPEHLYIYGGSAGGLLIGAVLNMKPELFAGAIADVPFVDVLNTMFDSTLTSTTSEYEEWGNPNIKLYFDYIRSYCPYQNVSHQAYPPILAMAGFYDTRVNYWEPAKWVAKLRDYKTDNNKIILITKMNEGHMGASGKLDFVKEIVTEYAFLLDLERRR